MYHIQIQPNRKIIISHCHHAGRTCTLTVAEAPYFASVAPDSSTIEITMPAHSHITASHREIFLLSICVQSLRTKITV